VSQNDKASLSNLVESQTGTHLKEDQKEDKH